ncbi:efflux RND transporter permease subunit [Luteibacter aegosomatissinici]|uniref:efflux RND transporter permease subunit n=1 Tax=Luteibacter aegosomatissinici TaxID=2911539 RepID=UPI001FF7FDDE|nr:efflux RND transporter permease subunit [Luteibacter aegosomatissinici]UPG92961.1 efflux RND transporter permease subunit [Luteibacter aegosomatissinici]
MNVFAPLIKRPAGASLLGIGLVLAGLWAYLQLGVAALPNVEFPAVVVFAQVPGANADTMANTVMAPLERHLGRIPGIRQMAGIADAGSAQVQLLFEFGTDTDAAARDVQMAINSAATDLPPGMPAPPQYFKFDTSQLPVLLITLSSDSVPPDRLFDLADSLAKPAIAQVDGVANVTVSGGSPHAVRVELDSLALAAKGITANDISNALIAANVTSALGTIGTSASQMTVLANDSLRDPAAFAQSIVAVRHGTPVRLADVASISSGQEDLHQKAWFNGQRSVVLQVSKRAEANAVATADAIRSRLPALRGLLPADTRITPIFDLTQSTKTALHEVELTLGVSVLMVAGVMLLFLRRWGPTLIAMASVPLSLAGAFVAMYLLGYTLNTLSLVALVLAIGFVVDDAIVVIENIVRHMEMDMAPLDAALVGTRDIGFTVVSITLSLIAVFAPMVFGHNIFVSLVHEFSVTLVVAIVVSAAVSLTITPALCGRYLRHQPRGGESGWAAMLARWDERVLRHYERMLAWAMRHRRVMRWQPVLLIVLTAALAVVVAATAGGGIMPDEDLGMLQATLRTDANVSPERLAERSRAVAETLLADTAVADVTAILGGGNGPGGAVGSTASFYVDLKPPAQRRVKVGDVIKRLASRFKGLSDVTVVMSPVQFFGGSGDTRSGGAQYQVQLTSSSGQGLQDTTLALARRMRTLPQVRDVGTSFDAIGKEQAVTVDRDAAARLGVSMAAVDEALYSAFGQRQIANIYSETNTYKIVLTASGAEALQPGALLTTYLRSDKGAMLPLSAVASIAPAITPTGISHYNQLESSSISYNLAPGVNQVQGMRIVDDLVAHARLPPGVQNDYSGSNQKLIEAVVGAMLMLMAVIVIMYVLLGILYESLLHPLTILSTLPAAGMGAYLAMFVTQTPLTLMSVIAVLMLIGIVKKNAIMMVDFALVAERERGMSPVDAIREAALVRFRPITMTTLAAMGAALPLAIGFGVGSEMRVPLGIAILGGLLVSQLLTLLSTPAIYLWQHDRRAAKALRRERRLAKGQLSSSPSL